MPSNRALFSLCEQKCEFIERIITRKVDDSVANRLNEPHMTLFSKEHTLVWLAVSFMATIFILLSMQIRLLYYCCWKFLISRRIITAAINTCNSPICNKLCRTLQLWAISAQWRKSETTTRTDLPNTNWPLKWQPHYTFYTYLNGCWYRRHTAILGALTATANLWPE